MKRKVYQGRVHHEILDIVRTLKSSTKNADLIHFTSLEKFVHEAKGTDLLELLSYFPLNSGGLSPLASGLFHPKWEIRRSVTFTLRQLSWNPVFIFKMLI